MPTRSLTELVVNRLEMAASQVFGRANKNSAGVDDISVKEAIASWPNEKRRIRQQLLSGVYRPKPLRPVVIRKVATKALVLGNARPISIPTVWDRVVQRAILISIWPDIRDHVFTECSFGGIPRYSSATSKIAFKAESVRKSVSHALAQIQTERSAGRVFVFETDICDFFSSLNRDRLIDSLTAKLRDDSINGLISEYLRQEIDQSARLGKFASLWSKDQGIAQGGVLSPMMANLYLHEFDARICAAGFHLIRYVDDLVVMVESEGRATEAYQLIQSLLPPLNLRMHPLNVRDERDRIKTRIVRPNESFDFLGVTIYQHSMSPKRSKVAQLRERISEVTDSRFALTLSQLVKGVNDVLKGWLVAFSFCDLSPQLLSEIDQLISSRTAVWLKQAGITRDRNCVSPIVAKRLGLLLASEANIKPVAIQKSGPRSQLVQS